MGDRETRKKKQIYITKLVFSSFSYFFIKKSNFEANINLTDMIVLKMVNRNLNPIVIAILR